MQIDANGSARTGMRFGSGGTAGQVLYVRNGGGENVTFHATDSTALIETGTDQDTISPGGIHHFVSDGLGWYLIGPPLAAG